MARYRDQSLVNLFAGLLISAEAVFRHNAYATRLSSTMYMGAGIVFVLSGIALFLAPESRSRRLPTPRPSAQV